MILEGQTSHAICGKCYIYVTENDQQEMKKNDGLNRKKLSCKAWVED